MVQVSPGRESADWQEWTLMKNNGENESNPRFLQLSTQLLAIQRAQTIKSAQQQHNAQTRPSQPPQAGPQQGSQGSPMMQQRPQENGQVNGNL